MFRSRGRLGVIALCYFLGSGSGPAAPERIEYQEVGPGVAYAHISKTKGLLSIHVVRFEYHQPDLKLVSTLGRGTIFGLASVRKEIAALPPVLGQPIAGINGDFFVMKKGPYQGDPHGLQIIGGELVSSPDKGPCFWEGPGGQPHMGSVHSQCKVTWPNGKETPIRVNEQRGLDNAVLLTPILGPSARTTNGLELVLESGGEPWLPLRANQTYVARVREVRTNANSLLTPDTMILSLGPKLASQLAPVQVGAHLRITTALSPGLNGVETAIGGGPALVSKGRSLHQPVGGTAKSALVQRNPRTALGWNDTDFFFVVVDGRKKDLSVGAGFAELADIMLEVGCLEALNLDGGGSTTLWLNGKVVNHPSENGVERNVANALVLVRK